MRLGQDGKADEQSGCAIAPAKQPVQRHKEQPHQEEIDVAQMQFAVQVYHTNE